MLKLFCLSLTKAALEFMILAFKPRSIKLLYLDPINQVENEIISG